MSAAMCSRILQTNTQRLATKTDAMSLLLATQVCQRWMSSESAGAKTPTDSMLDQILRVDHAGEFGAIQIYKGQIAVLGRTSVGPVLQKMMEQEKEHFNTFVNMMPKQRVRPTALLPIWNVAGFVLGASCALLGKEGAMACTVAVEEVIGNHYNSQIRTLMADGEDGPERHKELLKVISQFRDEELQHLETGLEHDAEKAPLYDVMTNVIKVGCKGAIWLSERV